MSGWNRPDRQIASKRLLIAELDDAFRDWMTMRGSRHACSAAGAEAFPRRRPELDEPCSGAPRRKRTCAMRERLREAPARSIARQKPPLREFTARARRRSRPRERMRLAIADDGRQIRDDRSQARAAQAKIETVRRARHSESATRTAYFLDRRTVRRRSLARRTEWSRSMRTDEIDDRVRALGELLAAGPRRRRGKALISSLTAASLDES